MVIAISRAINYSLNSLLR